MSIKSVLREELENSLQMEKNYARELAKLSAGSLVRRVIKGRVYYYLIFREKGRFRAVYRCKVCAAETKKYQGSRSTAPSIADCFRRPKSKFVS